VLLDGPRISGMVEKDAPHAFIRISALGMESRAPKPLPVPDRLPDAVLSTGPGEPKDRRGSGRTGGERVCSETPPGLDDHAAARAVGFARRKTTLAAHPSVMD
jgi:hypothetical protein